MGRNGGWVKVRDGIGVGVTAEQRQEWGGRGSGSGRDLELETRPGSHLLIAHQVDLDVR